MSASPQIYGLMVKVMQDIDSIGKNKKNVQQGYNFRGIDDVYLALNVPLTKHGVFYTTKVEGMVREERTTKSGSNLIYTVLTVRYTFYAPDGSFVECVVVGEGMDSGDKSVNKALSASLKYNLLQTFCIPTEEPKDSEHESHEVRPKQPPKSDASASITTRSTNARGVSSAQPAPATASRVNNSSSANADVHAESALPKTGELGKAGVGDLIERFKQVSSPAMVLSMYGLNDVAEGSAPGAIIKRLLESKGVTFDSATQSVSGLSRELYDETVRNFDAASKKEVA